MMTRTLLARCAPLAIAASAALPVLPAVAQDATAADPVIVIPPAEIAPVATTQAPAPVIVLPAPTPAIAEPAQTAAAPTEAAVAEQPVAAPAARTTTRRSAPVAAPAVTAVQPVDEAVAAPVAAAPAMPMASAVDAAEAVPVTEHLATNTDGTNEALIAGLLGALGLAAVGGVAVAASRRRRRRTENVDEVSYDAIEEPHVEQPVAHEPIAIRTPEPAFSTPVVPATSFAAAVPAPVMAQAAAPTRSDGARVTGDPVALPAEVPQTFEERDALLKELVAAEPDRANPFTGVRARARRAKLIMQSLGQDFQSRKPRIDLSEYTNRWPALRGWQPATA